MILRKIAAGITAFVCSACMLSFSPVFINRTYASEIVVDNDFEVNYDGWFGNSDAVKLNAVKSKGYENTRGMEVSGRQKPEDGACSEKGFYLTGNVEYTYSVWVQSDTKELFQLSLTYLNPKTGIYTTKLLKDKNISADSWTKLSANYTAPVGAVNLKLTITTDSTEDFCFDNVSVVKKTKYNSSIVNAASADKGLKDEFANYFRVGTCLPSGLINNSTIQGIILKDFNSITCENEMKPDATMVQSQCSGTNIAVSLSRAASILDFCVNNNIGVRGHTLVWHSQTPEWFFKENFNASGNWVSEAVMDQRMESYIKNIFAAIKTQYPSLNLYAYDVANECISDDANRTANYGGSRAPGYGNGASPWVQIYGDNGFVEKAFTYARKYAPASCKLFYNDYNEYWDHKRDSIASMCEGLYKKGILDGIGMQSHISAQIDGFTGVANYTSALQKFAGIGCEVQITELDISTEKGTYSSETQSQKYKAIFDAALNINKGNKGKVTAVCVWGVTDATSWIGSENTPLLYNANNQPKEAYNTVTEIIPKSEWGDGSNYGQPVGPNEYGWYFHSTFEGEMDSWQGRGDAALQTSGRTAYVGSESLLVMDRTAAWNGASRALNSSVFNPGNTYSFSANAMYFDGGNTEPFYLKLQYVDPDGVTNYSTIAEATAIKGEWVQLANKNYTIPSDASDMYLYIETADSTNNFYLDEIIGAVAGTSIIGAGSQIIILGDVNLDGIINVYDLSLAKRGILKGFGSKAQEIAADVDQSGNTDAKDITYIQQFIVGKITEFPVAEKTVDTAKMDELFSKITLTSSYKKDGENNPLFTQRFGADPGVMEYNGRIYVYTTNDVIEYDSSGNVIENTYGKINKINCISSDDMVNWTDHGAIEVAGSTGAAAWASNSWAPCAAHKTINGKEKFFLYFANGGNGISVLTADSPTGPWNDPLGKALITRSTPNCSNVAWLFDPAVLVDDDGTGYLYFGGGVPSGQDANPKTARVVKLSDNMIGLAGTPQEIDAPYLFEDSGINKIGNKYYYTYCSNWNTSGNSYGMTSGAIEYMVSSNPMGPFTYGGEFFKNQGNFFGLYGNNHHSIIEFKNQYYLVYHSRPVEAQMGITGNYRSPQIDKLTISGEQLKGVTGTMTGIAQLEKLNPYQKVQAETMSNQAGINTKGLGDTVVTDTGDGDWIQISGVEFSKGASKLTIKAASKNGGAIKVCTGSASDKALGYAEISASNGAFTEITVPVNLISGTQDLFFVFSGDVELDYWMFT